MKANQDKYYILLNTKTPIDMPVEMTCITFSLCGKLLGMTIYSDLKFYKHICNLCDKVSKKINALCRVTSYMSFKKRRTVMKRFAESQFNYCSLI